MNRKDLDALNELYLSVYDGEQLDENYLEEAPNPNFLQGWGDGRNYGDPVRDLYNKSIEASKRRQEQVKKEKEQQAATRASTERRDMGVVLRDGKYKVIYTKTPEALALADRLNKEEGRNKPKQTEQPTRTPVPERPKPGSSSTPPPRPATSSTVLAKQKGVEGKLDKATGKFTAGAFSDTEKSRYSSVAAQNAARNSASSGAATPAAAQPKPAAPAVGKLGNTSFERRTPTSAELKAAQGARDKGASPEKALQAAQKTNLPTTGPTPAIPDLKSVNTDLAKANSPAVINRPAPAGSALAKQQAQQKLKPPTPGTMTQSYEWPSAKTIRDIADAYSSIYEAKKVDQDQDGDNDFADVRIARMIASGMSKAEAIAAVRNKSYNEEVEIDEATAMAKRGYDETEIRNKIAKSTGGGEFADKATALENRPTYGDSAKQKARKDLARAQRGDFRKTTSSSPGLHGYAYKSDDPAVKAKQAARGAQRGVLTPREKKQFNKEAYEAYEFVASYLLENNFASTVEDANVIINNMSEGWFNQIMEG